MKKVGIIGGKGRMGAFFADIFKKQGMQVLISDKDTPLSNKELVEQAEIVLLSVTFGENVGVIREIKPYLREDQLLMDVASLKERILKEMLATKASVIGMHPLFAPSNSLDDKVVVFCPVRAGKWEDWISKVLEKEKIRISKMDPLEHDKLMAYVQALTHFTLLVFSDVISHEVDVKTSFDHATPVYKLILSLGCRVLSQSANLYAGIEMYNAHFPKALLALKASFQHLDQIVKENDKEAFIAFFERIGKRLGPIKEEGADFSEELLRHLKDKI